ncbi:MAG: glycoside hydrolase family 127 protein, partial [Anaerolineae bacterium]|nr:glycoside hydrolase family 127 protein [Anaerolineae bacterium]
GEAFGKPYELPPDQGYCETCAAIASIMWNLQMLLVTGEARFADLMERTLYNGFLSGLAADGLHFFYMNPLLSRGGYARREWYGVACCPPNIMRLLASLGHYLVTADPTGLQIHLYNNCAITTELASGQTVGLRLETDYPWQGQIKLTVQETGRSAWALRLRVPGWCTAAQVTVNNQALADPLLENGYLVLERVWSAGDVVELALTLAPQLIEALPRIDAIRNSLAIEYGPLVYCLEAIDTPANLLDIHLEPETPLQAVWRDDLLPEPVMIIETTGYAINTDAWQGQLYRPLNSQSDHTELGQPVPLTAIPYYAWANREPGQMRVWIPRLTGYKSQP